MSKKRTQPCLCGDPMCPRCFPAFWEKVNQQAVKGPSSRSTHWMLPSGHSLVFEYRFDSKVLTVNLVHKSGEGGNELLRIVLDEKSLLQHVRASDFANALADDGPVPGTLEEVEEEQRRDEKRGLYPEHEDPAN